MGNQFMLRVQFSNQSTFKVSIFSAEDDKLNTQGKEEFKSKLTPANHLVGLLRLVKKLQESFPKLTN